MFQLNESDQRYLLRIARQAVQNRLRGVTQDFPIPSSETLLQHLGVFVSLHENSQLRGCIGNIQPVGPIYRTVAECAVSAAFSDPRFLPLSEDEFTKVDWEI